MFRRRVVFAGATPRRNIHLQNTIHLSHGKNWAGLSLNQIVSCSLFQQGSRKRALRSTPLKLEGSLNLQNPVSTVHVNQPQIMVNYRVCTLFSKGSSIRQPTTLYIIVKRKHMNSNKEMCSFGTCSSKSLSTPGLKGVIPIMQPMIAERSRAYLWLGLPPAKL